LPFSAALEALIEDPGIAADTSPRVALFRSFSGIWNSIDLNTNERADPAAAAERHLSGITPLPRQAFLLVSMEGFAEAEAAAILGVTEQELRRLVDESGRQMADEIATDVMIIEDEPMIAMDLEAIVTGLGHRVTGVARTHAEAVTLAKEKLPGLILADIQLADMSSGMDAVNELLQSMEVPVIFITAFPERFLTGERPEPTFLITKPFPPTMVSAVISQALFFEQKAKRVPRNPASVG
jgi:CheY-like chemotaxis protein